jgi:hypothetical protein
MYRLVRVLTIVLAVVLALQSAWGDDDEGTLRLTSLSDLNPALSPPVTNPTMDDQWDLLFSSMAGMTCDDNQLFGVEFADGHFYITGGNSGSEPNKVYILNPEGTLVGVFDQWNSIGWGWHDLAYDGDYLYAGDYTGIYAFDFSGTPVPSMNIPAGGYALAYDPATDHFWVGTSSGLAEIDRAGNIIWFGPGGVTFPTGLAWDDAVLDGPWLWIFDHTGSPLTTIHQFDPESHVLTGLTYQLPLLPGSTDQVAAGLAFTDEWDPAVHVLVGMTQGTPEDQLFCLEMYPVLIPQVAVTMTPYNPPITIPAIGGSFDFNVALENSDPGPVTFDAWIMIQLPDLSWYGPVLGPVNLTLPGMTTIDRDRTQNVPAGAPSGSYIYEGRVGVYPDEIWESDSFTFEKLETGDGIPFSDWNNTGEPLEMWLAETDAEISTDFVLHGAYPNPFNPTTTISFSLPEALKINLSVYDISGRWLTSLTDGYRDAGNHEVTFDGSNLPSGMYVVRLEAGSFSSKRKIVLVK